MKKTFALLLSLFWLFTASPALADWVSNAGGSGGGGSGTVGSGNAGQVAYYQSTGTTVIGDINMNISNGALSLGQSTSVAGSVVLFGSTSGSATIRTAAIAGTSTIFQLPANNGTSGYVLQTDGTGVTSWVAASGSGTVTSVAFTGDGVVFNSVVPGSPVTASGTFAPTLHTDTANTIFAGPTTGSAATPTFRALVAADIPAASGPVVYGGAESSNFAAVANTWYTITGTVTVTLPASVASTGPIGVFIASGGTATFATTSGTINGATNHASSALVDGTQGDMWWFTPDGTNYEITSFTAGF